ncbi:MAG: endonuclease/exonuclease/phosphatase family protein [Polyangiaceae bacterium]|nr:endonuclease/exonuclease/phosphatase family protein [Polyangiaceae bacterium]
MNRPASAPLALLFLGCADPGSVTTTPTAARHQADPASIEVMTYNLNYGLAGDRETLLAIASEDPDVVFLQETTDAWESELVRELGGRYPHKAFRHCCGAGGLGVLSKFPIEEREYLDPPDGGWFPAWRFIVHAPIGTFQALAVHLRPQLSESGSFLGGVFVTPPIRLAEIETYFPKLDPALPTLVAGDFNENGRGRAIRFLEDRGMVSALPAASGSAPTWRWNTSLGEIREQLDHLVFDQRLVVTNVRVIERGNSDHLPVVATVQAAPSPLTK